MKSPGALFKAAAAVLVLAVPGPRAADFSGLSEEEMTLHHRAVAHWGLGMLDTAEGEFAALLKSCPKQPAVLANLGLLRLVRRRPAEAAGDLETALAESPKNPRVRYLLGRARLGAGRSEDAVKEFHEAAALAPGEAEIRFRLSEALLAAGRGPLARGELRKVLALDPRHGPALYRLGRSLVSLGRKKEGEAFLARFAEVGNREKGRSRPFRYDEPLEPAPSNGQEPPAEGSWLEVRAVPAKPGRAAVVTVSAGKLIQRRESGPKPVRFALGARARADSVKADWSNGTHTYQVGVDASQTIVLSEVAAHVW